MQASASVNSGFFSIAQQQHRVVRVPTHSHDWIRGTRGNSADPIFPGRHALRIVGVCLVQHGKLMVRASRGKHSSGAVGPGDSQDSGMVVGRAHHLQGGLAQAAPGDGAIVPAQGQELGVRAERHGSDGVSGFACSLPDLLLAERYRGPIHSKHTHHLHPVVPLDGRRLRGGGCVGLLALGISNTDLSLGEHSGEPLPITGPGQGVGDEVGLRRVHRAHLLHRLSLAGPRRVHDDHPAASKAHCQSVLRPPVKSQRQDSEWKSSGNKKRCGGSGIQPQGLPLTSEGEQVERGGHYGDRTLALLLVHHLERLDVPDGDASLFCPQA
mmetsp:Transcript_29489/g.70721  ORF Transcript_29489/g.70721 Transcript_29489/m.70721 type:complete len:325 (-) Transcript_29489:540-1514(-)